MNQAFIQACFDPATCTVSHVGADAATRTEGNGTLKIPLHAP